MVAYNDKNLSNFAAAALGLDVEFQQFEKLTRELKNLNLNSDKGMQRAGELYTDLADCRDRMQEVMKAFSQSLEKARVDNEACEQVIVECTRAVADREKQSIAMLERFQMLGNRVREVNTLGTDLIQLTTGGEPTAEFKNRLPEFDTRVLGLIEDAKSLMDDAREANMKTIERNADSLRQNLQGARHRLNLILERHAPN